MVSLDQPRFTSWGQGGASACPQEGHRKGLQGRQSSTSSVCREKVESMALGPQPTDSPTFLDITDLICTVSIVFCCCQCLYPFFRCIFSFLETFLDKPSPFAICAFTSASFFSLQSRILISHVYLILGSHFLELYCEPNIDAFYNSLLFPVVNLFQKCVFFLGGKVPHLSNGRTASYNTRVYFLVLSSDEEMSAQVWAFGGCWFFGPLPVHLVAIRTLISDL